MINLSLSLTKSLSYTIIWVLFVIPSCVLSFDERHRLCTPLFKCGDQTNLYYPFWKDGREECGLPQFKVNCNGDFAEFSISSVKFRILKMNYESRIIRIARMDYPNNRCPYPENVTVILIQDVLPFLRDTELLTVYYHCPFLPCEDGIGGKRDFLSPPSYSRDKAILDKFNALCKTNFSIPVSRSALRIAERNQSPAMKEALDQGFMLGFNSDCSRCVASKGACGYNKSSDAFACYCKNGPHRIPCKNHKDIVKPVNDYFRKNTMKKELPNQKADGSHQQLAQKGGKLKIGEVENEDKVRTGVADAPALKD